MPEVTRLENGRECQNVSSALPTEKPALRHPPEQRTPRPPLPSPAGRGPARAGAELRAAQPLRV